MLTGPAFIPKATVASEGAMGGLHIEMGLAALIQAGVASSGNVCAPRYVLLISLSCNKRHCA